MPVEAASSTPQVSHSTIRSAHAAAVGRSRLYLRPYVRADSCARILPRMHIRNLAYPPRDRLRGVESSQGVAICAGYPPASKD